MIAASEQEKHILAGIEDASRAEGMEIVRVRVSGGRRPVLQIMAETAGGAPTDINDCTRLTRTLSTLFEINDPLPGAYTLEVSTPGIDRPLTRPGDFARWIGHAARIELKRPVDGQRRFRGLIAGERDGQVSLSLDDGNELVAGLDEMTRASLILTDALIDAARADGSLPPQPDEDGLEGFEIDETQEQETLKQE